MFDYHDDDVEDEVGCLCGEREREVWIKDNGWKVVFSNFLKVSMFYVFLLKNTWGILCDVLFSLFLFCLF